MKHWEYRDLLRQAAGSDWGIRLRLVGWTHAERLRRGLYYARDRMRGGGDRSFDELSVLLKPPDEVWIVRRDRLPGRGGEDDHLRVEAEWLERHELPRRVLARGPQRRRHRIPGLDLLPREQLPDPAAVLDEIAQKVESGELP